MKFDRRTFSFLLAGLGVSASGSVLAQGKTVEVSMKQAPRGQFVPQTVNIAVGDTVKWTNPGVITHTVTFDPAHRQHAWRAVYREQVKITNDLAERAGVVEHDPLSLLGG